MVDRYYVLWQFWLECTPLLLWGMSRWKYYTFHQHPESQKVHYSFSDVLKVPSDISDHDASIISIECPKFQTRSFQREVWLYERTMVDRYYVLWQFWLECTLLRLWGMSRWKYYTFHQHPESQKVMHSNRRYHSIHYSFSDVLKVPSDISDHDASIIFIECPKFQTRSFQREVWLYEWTDNFSITFVKLSKFIVSINLLLWEVNKSEFRSPVSIMFWP
jgi:hypothetical protein